MHIELPHKSSQAAAVARIKKALVDARPHMAGQVQITKEEWNNSMLTFAFIVQKKEVTGTVRVTDADYTIDAKLPLLWRMFEGKIEKMIREQAAGLVR